MKKTAQLRGRVPNSDLPRAIEHACVGNADDRAAVSSSYREGEEYRKVAVAWLLNRYRSERHRQVAENNYTLPAYGEHQADCNGCVRTIEEVLSNLFGVNLYGTEAAESIRPSAEEEGSTESQG